MKKLSLKICEILKNSINNVGYATLVVPGGASPIELFSFLIDIQLDWSKIFIIPVDDRKVSQDDINSNIFLIKKHLHIGNANQAELLSLNDQKEKILKLKRPFDVVVLGMGQDGHFASLFPDMIDHKKAFSINHSPAIISTGKKGSPFIERTSMNLSLILDSKFCCLILSNDDKVEVFKKSVLNKSSPVYYLINQNINKVHLVINGKLKNDH